MAFKPLKLASPSSSNEALSTSLHKINDMLEELYQTTDDLAVASVEGDLSGVSQNIVPGANNTYDLGSASNKWRSLYVSENTIYIGDSQLTIDFDGNLKVNNNKVTEIVDYNDLLNKPLLSAVATSGNYEDLSDKPVLTAVAINGRFADLTNKPTTIAGYGITDAFSGDYEDLTNKPVIPQDINQLTDIDKLLVTRVPMQGAAPSNPLKGDLWWDTETLELKIYDGDEDWPTWIRSSALIKRSESSNFPPVSRPRKPGSVFQTTATSENALFGGLYLVGDLVMPFGGRLCIREEIVFQDGTLQWTAYQGRELQKHVITSGVFYDKTITEPAGVIGWGSSDEFGNHISSNGSMLLVGAPKTIFEGDTNSAGVAFLYNLSSGSLVATLYSNDYLIYGNDNIDSNFGASCASNSTSYYVGEPGNENASFPGQRTGAVWKFNNIGWFVDVYYPPVLDLGVEMSFGASIAVDDTIIAISAPDYPCAGGGTGRVYIYSATNTGVSPNLNLLGFFDNPFGQGKYGTSLSIHEDPYAAANGYYTASVITVGSDVAINQIYVRQSDGSVSRQTYAEFDNPNPEDDEFGRFVTANSRYIVTSSYNESPVNDSTGSGVVYVWEVDAMINIPPEDPSEGLGWAPETSLKWKFTFPANDPNYDFGRGLSLIEDDVLAVAGANPTPGNGVIRFYDLNTGTILNEVKLDLPIEQAELEQLGRNSVLLTETHLIAHAPGSGKIYIYDYQKTITSSHLTKGKALISDGFGGFGLATPTLSLSDLTNVDVSGAANNNIIKYNSANQTWEVGTPVVTLGNLTDVDVSGAVTGNILRYNGVSETWELGTASDGGGASAINDLTDVNTSGVSDGQSLVYNSGTWAPSTIVGLKSRQTASEQTLSIADGASDDITILGVAKTYALLSIETSAAAWVTLYTDTTSRTNDAGRNEFTDPTPGSGVIAEVITSGATTQIITPGTFGWNNDGTPSTNVYAKVVNKSGGTTPITVTLKFVPLEI